MYNLLIFIASLALGIGYYYSFKNEEKVKGRKRYFRTNSSGYFLYGFFSILSIVIFFPGAHTYVYSFYIGFKSLLCLVLFYTILLIILPYLRKHMSNRGIATLWFLPELFVLLADVVSQNNARYTIRLPLNSIQVKWLGGIWLAGFSIYFSWHVLQHIIFKRTLNQHSIQIEDPEILEVFDEVLHELNHKMAKKIYRSPLIHTPLSIDNASETRFYLPDVEYSREDLRLIFKHELIHVMRRDTAAKIIVVLIKSICFMIPFKNRIFRKCLNDLELSCDETVLLDEDDNTRKRYAHLILSNVGNEKGFTTCLSANGKALKYRLESIQQKQKPKGALFGAIVTAVLFFGGIMVTRAIDISYNPVSLQTILPQAQINDLRYIDDTITVYRNKEAFVDYINQLDVYYVIFEDYDFENNYYFWWYEDNSEGINSICMNEKYIRVLDNNWDSTLYELKEPISLDEVKDVLTNKS